MEISMHNQSSDKKKKTPKQIAALICVALLVGCLLYTSVDRGIQCPLIVIGSPLVILFYALPEFIGIARPKE